MKVTKKGVEECIAKMDELIKALANEEGLFDYRSKNLLYGWSNIRQSVANCASRVISGTTKKDKKNKQKIRDYSAVNSSDVINDASKVIEIAKSKSAQAQKPKTTMFIKVKGK